MQRTTIALTPTTRDRLKIYGRKSDTFEDIILALMDAVDPTNLTDARIPTVEARRIEADELAIWRKKSADEKVRVGDRLMMAAYRSNPAGVRRAKQWPAKGP